VSKRDAFPIPDIHDALDYLRGSQYFATIDLLYGYCQLGMTEQQVSILYTAQAISIHPMPFGLAGSPASFCRFTSIIFQDHL